GSERFFVTWGRVQDSVDPNPGAALVLRHAAQCDLGGKPVGARVCWSLAEARDAHYFYEALVHFASQSVSDGRDFQEWLALVSEQMERGAEIYYLGSHHGPGDPGLQVLRL